MLAVQLKSAVTVFGGKGASGLPRVAFELEVRERPSYLGGGHLLKYGASTIPRRRWSNISSSPCKVNTTFHAPPLVPQ